MYRLAVAVLFAATLEAPDAVVTVTPEKLSIATGQCNGEDLSVRLTNPGDEPVFADARLSADDALHLPRRLISTWLPPGYTRTVPVTVSAAAGTPAGTYTVRVKNGGERLDVPVTVAPPVPSENLARSASRVTASSARAGLLACGAVDGDADPARWWKGTGWADATGKQWPDWYRITWETPQRIGRVELTTVDSAEFPVDRFGLRDWDVQVATNDGWETVARVRGNRAATVTSRFAERRSTEVRVLTYAANGTNDWSRVVELSVYQEEPHDLPAADLSR
jgi:hypothetical protein